MSIAENLRRIRESKGLTQVKLSILSGVSRVSIGNYERGDRIPTTGIAIQLANALDVSLEEIIERKPTRIERIAYLDGRINTLENMIMNLTPNEKKDEVRDTIDLLKKELQELEDEPEDNEQDELTDYLDELHKRPEMKMLFKVAKNASKEDVEKAVKIIEMLKGNASDDM